MKNETFFPADITEFLFFLQKKKKLQTQKKRNNKKMK